MSQKLNLWLKAQHFNQQFKRYLKITDVGCSMQLAFTSNAEEILKIQTFKDYKNKLQVRWLIIKLE
jgi:hypothetical protein